MKNPSPLCHKLERFQCIYTRGYDARYYIIILYTEPQKKRRTKNTVLNSPYIYTMKLSICVIIKFWCSGTLLLLNFL